jgi:hypothetical protein
MENQGQGALRPCSLEDSSYEKCIKDSTTFHTLASTCACKNTKWEHLFDHTREPKNNKNGDGQIAKGKLGRSCSHEQVANDGVGFHSFHLMKPAHTKIKMK